VAGTNLRLVTVGVVVLLGAVVAICTAGARPKAAGPGTGYVLVGMWGKDGTAKGQFSGARGIATDKAGKVYVADTNNNRIQMFTSNGTFLRAWGSVGDHANQFQNPRDVAISPDGTVWVADEENVRLVQFPRGGGKEMGAVTLSRTELPRGIAVNADREVLSALEGEGVGSFRKYIKGNLRYEEDTHGPYGFGHFAPLDVEVASDGTVYLDTQTLDPVTAHVYRFSADGERLGAIKLPYPSPGIGVDLDCNVWASDPTQRHIVKYSPEGKALATASVPDLLANDIAVGPTGDLYVAWQGGGIVHFAEDRSKPGTAVVSGFKVFGLDPPASWRANFNFTANGIACPATIPAKVTLKGLGTARSLQASGDPEVTAGKASEVEIPLSDPMMLNLEGQTITAALTITLKTNGRPTTRTTTVRFTVPKYAH
jgi:sugar lactone lactonase YvrE